MKDLSSFLCLECFEGIFKKKNSLLQPEQIIFVSNHLCETLQFSPDLNSLAAEVGSFHSIFEWKAFWEDGQTESMLRELIILIDLEVGIYSVYAWCSLITRGFWNSFFLILCLLRAFA